MARGDKEIAASRGYDLDSVLAEAEEILELEVIIPLYRFFYREERNVVWVVAMWYGAQEPTSPTY